MTGGEISKHYFPGLHTFYKHKTRREEARNASVFLAGRQLYYVFYVTSAM